MILSLSNIQQMSIVQQWELFIQTVHTLTKSMLTTSCTTASVQRAVYQDGGVINILAKSLRRRTIELQLLWLLCIVMWKWITWNQYRTSCAANIVNCLILKKLFSKHDAWLINSSDNAATIWGKLSRLSIWEAAYKNILSVETSPRYLAWCWGKLKIN